MGFHKHSINLSHTCNSHLKKPNLLLVNVVCRREHASRCVCIRMLLPKAYASGHPNCSLIHCVAIHTMKKPWSTQVKPEDVLQDLLNALHLLVAFQSMGVVQT